jgi:hypothetical protein
VNKARKKMKYARKRDAHCKIAMCSLFKVENPYLVFLLFNGTNPVIVRTTRGSIPMSDVSGFCFAINFMPVITNPGVKDGSR